MLEFPRGKPWTTTLILKNDLHVHGVAFGYFSMAYKTSQINALSQKNYFQGEGG